MPAVARTPLSEEVFAAPVGDALSVPRDALGYSPVHPLQQRLAEHFAGADATRHPADYAWGAKAAIVLTAALAVWAAIGTVAYLALSIG